ncbi:MAG: flagellin [Firmicutes bacterium]|nr:flagellin [Bacillota bacterium]
MAQSDLTRIASNIAGLNALNALKDINTKLGIHQLRLSTGKRINQAADDPAGLTIGVKFNYRVRGLGVAIDNIGDAKNLLAVAEGGLSKISDILLTIRDKTVQAASDTLSSAERDAIAAQVNQLLTEIDTIAKETKWNGKDLISGTGAFTFQTGVESGQYTEFSAQSANLTTLGLDGTLDLSTYTAADAYIGTVDSAIETVSRSMTTIGALVSRLTSKEENLTIAKTNNEAAYSRIMNADMAAEQLEAMKLSILQQTATAMLAQANVAPQAVLSLFR